MLWIALRVSLFALIAWLVKGTLSVDNYRKSNINLNSQKARNLTLKFSANLGGTFDRLDKAIKKDGKY